MFPVDPSFVYVAYLLCAIIGLVVGLVSGVVASLILRLPLRRTANRYGCAYRCNRVRHYCEWAMASGISASLYCGNHFCGRSSRITPIRSL